MPIPNNKHINAEKSRKKNRIMIQDVKGAK